MDFMFPSTLKRFCGHLLAVAAGCDVCCVLQCSGDRKVRPPICCPNQETVKNAPDHEDQEFVVSSVIVYDQRLLAQRPGTAAVVKRSAGLDCASVSPLGSVVTPGSASFNPPTTA